MARLGGKRKAPHGLLAGSPEDFLFGARALPLLLFSTMEAFPFP